MAIPARQIRSVGQATINDEGDITLPDGALRDVDWKQGDQIRVTVVDGDQILLTKRPDDVVERFAGALTHLYPEPGDIRRFLDEERASWVDFDRRFDD